MDRGVKWIVGISTGLTVVTWWVVWITLRRVVELKQIVKTHSTNIEVIIGILNELTQ